MRVTPRRLHFFSRLICLFVLICPLNENEPICSSSESQLMIDYSACHNTTGVLAWSLFLTIQSVVRRSLSVRRSFRFRYWISCRRPIDSVAVSRSFYSSSLLLSRSFVVFNYFCFFMPELQSIPTKKTTSTPILFANLPPLHCNHLSSRSTQEKHTHTFHRKNVRVN